MSVLWKPCDKLTAADFDISPVWGFDLGREGEPEEADETWVKPYSFSSVPDATDLLFVQGRLEPRRGGVLAGAVTVRFSEKHPIVEGVVLLAPTYCAIGLRDGVVPVRERGYVEMAVTNVKDLFPLKYEAVLRLGDQEVPLRGTAHLGW